MHIQYIFLFVYMYLCVWMCVPVILGIGLRARDLEQPGLQAGSAQEKIILDGTLHEKANALVGYHVTILTKGASVFG